MRELKRVSRRGFLNYVTTLMGVSAATAVVMAQENQPTPPDQAIQEQAQPESKGYRHTKHVDTYYQLADL